MTDIFKSADWARDVERARAEAAKPDGIIGSDKGLEYTKALAAEALKGVWRGAPNGARFPIAKRMKRDLAKIAKRSRVNG